MRDSSHCESLFVRLFDDAGLFPPAALRLDRALVVHAHHEQNWYAPMVGPFVCAASHLAAVAAADHGDLDIAVVVRGAPELNEALAAVQAAPSLRLAAVEVRLTAGYAAPAATSVRAAAGAVPIYGEVPISDLDETILDAFAAAEVRLKLRTGGTERTAFPTEAHLAAAIQAAVDRDMPFKCTAGLHGATRHTDARTGFEHHGFLNLLLAVAICLDGGEPRDALAERNGHLLAQAVGRLSTHGIDDVRRLFRSFGTCDIDEPVGDLVALGLVTPTDSPVAARRY